MIGGKSRRASFGVERYLCRPDRRLPVTYYVSLPSPSVSSQVLQDKRIVIDDIHRVATAKPHLCSDSGRHQFDPLAAQGKIIDTLFHWPGLAGDLHLRGVRCANRRTIPQPRPVPRSPLVVKNAPGNANAGGSFIQSMPGHWSETLDVDMIAFLRFDLPAEPSCAREHAAISCMHRRHSR